MVNTLPNLSSLGDNDFLWDLNGKREGFRQETLEKYANAIKELNIEQANLALTAQGLNRVQRDQVLAQAGMITTSNTLEASTIRQRVATAALTDEKQKELLRQLGLITADGAEITTTEALTKEKIEEAVATLNLSAAEKEATIAKLMSTGANGALSVSFGVLGAKIKEATIALGKFLFTTPAGWAILAATGIFAAVKAYDALTVSVEEAREKAGESLEDFNNLKSEYQSLQQELASNAQKMDELNDKESLSFIEQEELNKLKENSEELRRQLELTRALTQEAKNKSQQDALNFLEKRSSYQTYGHWDNSQVENGNELYGHQEYGELYTGNQVELAEKQLEDLKWLSEEKSRVEEEIRQFQLSNGSNEEDYSIKQKNQLANLQRELHSYDLAIQNLDQTLFDTVPELDKFMASLDPDTHGTLIQDIKNLISEFSIFKNGEGVNATEAFDEIWNSKDFSKVRQQLEELSKAGKLDPDSFQSVEGYQKLLDATGKTAEEITGHINSMNGAINETEEAPTSKLGMIGAINGMSEGFDALDKIYDSVAKGKGFDYTLLDDETFKNIFKNFTPEYENFIETITNSPKDINGCKTAFSDLISVWLDGTDVLSNVTEETAGLTTAMLQTMGIANASDLVAQSLQWQASEAEAVSIEQKYLASTGLSLADSSWEVVSGFANEQNASELTIQALAELKLAQMDLSNNPISLDSNISEILSLAKSAKVGAVELAKVQRLATLQSKIDSGNYNLTDWNEFDRLSREMSSDTSWSDVEIEFEPVKYTGGGPETGSGSDSSKEPKSIDLIERRIQVIKDEDSRLQSAIDSLDTTYGSIGDVMNPDIETKDSLIAKQIENDKVLISEYEKAVQQYGQAYQEALAKANEEYPDLPWQTWIEEGGSEFVELTEDQNKIFEDLSEKWSSTNDAETSLFETREKLNNDYDARLQNTIKSIEEENELLEAQRDNLDSYISYLETAGKVVGSGLYEALISNVQKQKNNKSEELRYLYDELDSLDGNKDERYYNLKDQINDTEAALLDLEIAQEEYNNTLLELPINNLQVELDMFDNIQSAYDNWAAEQEASGKKLTTEYYQAQINNGSAMVKKYQEQADAVRDVMDEFDVGSDKWNEHFQQLQDINSSISSIVQNMHEWNEELLNLPLTNLNEFTADLQNALEGLNGLQDEYSTVISAVTGAIDDYKSSLEDENDAVNESFETRIEALEDQKELLNKNNDALKLQLAYEQALSDLATQNQQKTVAVIRNGTLMYEANAKDLADAEQAVQDALYDLEVDKIEKQIESLQEELDAINEDYQNQVKSLDEQSNKWSEILSKIQQAQDELKADQILGAGWKELVITGKDEDLFTAFQQTVASNADMILKYEQQITATENIYSLLQEYITSYREGSITFAQTQSGIQNLLSQLNQEMTAGTNMQNILDYLALTNDSEATADGVLAGIQNSLNESAEQLKTNLEQYNENLALIADCATTWEILVDNVSEIRNLMEDVAEALEDGIDDIVSALDGYRSRIEDEEELEDDVHEDKSSGVITSGMNGGSYSDGRTSSSYSYSEAPSHNDDQDPDHGPGVSSSSSDDDDDERNDAFDMLRHDGLFSDYFEKGSSDDQRLHALRMIGGHELKPNEVPIIGLKDELGITAEQQKALLHNYGVAQQVAAMKGYIAGANMHQNASSRIINIQFGDLNLPDVRDVDGFARALTAQFPNIMRQELSKWN